MIGIGVCTYRVRSVVRITVISRPLHGKPSALRSRPLLRSRHVSSIMRRFRSAARAASAARPYVAASAHVHPSAQVHPGAIVMEGAYVGARAVLRPGSVVGAHSHVGEGTVLGCHVSLENCRIGAHCLLHSGVRIGADGFGFYFDEHGHVRKKPQLLRALLGDGVEVGAGTCIDRGSWRDTTVGDETKIDNLVQIGHNVIIGRASLICAHAALAGSSELGDRCVMGGKSAIADHVRVCSGVRIAAKSGVTKHITVPGDYAGFPAQPASAWRRQVAVATRGAARPSRFSAADDET